MRLGRPIIPKGWLRTTLHITSTRRNHSNPVLMHRYNEDTRLTDYRNATDTMHRLAYPTKEKLLNAGAVSMHRDTGRRWRASAQSWELVTTRQ